jgi:serine/threonine protein kinase
VRFGWHATQAWMPPTPSRPSTVRCDPDRETIRRRFSDEAKASSTSCNQSRHIVSVHDYGEQDRIPSLVTELVVGERLETRGPRSPHEALTVRTQAARALSVAHKAKLIHRDLKPGNVFSARRSGRPLVKVLNFGRVRFVQASDENVTQKWVRPTL